MGNCCGKGTAPKDPDKAPYGARAPDRAPAGDPGVKALPTGPGERSKARGASLTAEADEGQDSAGNEQDQAPTHVRN